MPEENQIRLLQPNEIEVKIKQVSEKGAVALLYKTARVDMAILDETFGAFNWSVDYRDIKDNLYCGIGVRSNSGDFVWKWDCGVESREDGEGNEKKGEASDAFKRAGFKWGIGRELYTAPFIFLSLPTKQNGSKWVLQNSFQRFFVSAIDYDDTRAIKEVVISNDKGEVVFSTKTPKKKPLTKTKPDADTQDDELRLAIEDFIAVGLEMKKLGVSGEQIKEVISKHNEGNPNARSVKTVKACADIKKEIKELVKIEENN